MTGTELIQPGNKIEITLIQQMEQKDKTGEKPKIYKSQVLDLNDKGMIQIYMPSEKGKLILLPLGVRFEFMFYTETGLYRAIGQVKERYRKDNIYMLEIELKSRLEKFQRREFYRYSCIMDMSYFILKEEEAVMETVDEIFQSIRDDDFYSRMCSGKILDLSGGGARLVTEEHILAGSYLLLGIDLRNAVMDKQYYIVGNTVDCKPVENEKVSLYEVRVKFMIKDDKVREEIIKYIFEEERRMRQRGKG